MSISKTNLQRFESKINKTNFCWLWLGTKPQGYGLFKFNNKTTRANRVAYQLYIGPIPNNLYVLHTCDQTDCVNPKHLFLGTPLDNMKDKVQKGRHKYNPNLLQYNGSGINNAHHHNSIWKEVKINPEIARYEDL